MNTILYSRVHIIKEKRVSNCTIAAHKRCFRITKCMFSTTQWRITIKTILFSFLCTLDNMHLRDPFIDPIIWCECLITLVYDAIAIYILMYRQQLNNLQQSVNEVDSDLELVNIRGMSVQISYKLELPPHLILPSTCIKLVEPIGQGSPLSVKRCIFICMHCCALFRRVWNCLQGVHHEEPGTSCF